LKFQGRRFSFGEIDASVNRVANGLVALGLRPGDRVALMLPSHPDHLVAILALAKVGLVRVPINTALIGASLAHPFETFAPRALIADARYKETLASVLPAGNVELQIWRGDDQPRSTSFEAALLGCPDASPPPFSPAPDDIIALTPSSGTTGAPKGVNKSDRTLRAGPMGTLKLTGAGPGDVFLLWESLHHGAGVAVVIAAIIEKLTLAMVEKFSASQFWNECRANDVTHIHYLGGVLPMLLKQPPRPDDREHKVRIAWGGGCPPEVWHPFAERFGVKMREGYGLSEMITFVMVNPDGPDFSIGKPLAYFDVKLGDDHGEEVPVGEPGEIMVRSRVPGLQFLGYFRNEKAAQDAMLGDWFRTGDLARKDAQGFHFFAGRKKDTVRRRGINISAWEVERIVGEHDAVVECALVGVPSELGDEELKIFVRLAEGATLTPRELLEWCKTRMPAFQVPRYVEWIDEFPKTPTQRIRKRELSLSVATAWDAESNPSATRTSRTSA